MVRLSKDLHTKRNYEETGLGRKSVGTSKGTLVKESFSERVCRGRVETNSPGFLSHLEFQ